MSDGIVFMDGEYMRPQEASMSIFDTGFVWGDGVYDVTSTWNGWFFMLDEHLERFARSCEGFRLENPYSFEEMRRICAECVDRAGLSNAYVKMQITRGVPPPGVRDPRGLTPSVVVYAVPYVWIWGEDRCRQRREPLRERRRARLLERHRPALQELQPGRPGAGAPGGIRPRVRRRPPGRARRLPHRGAGLQLLRRARRHRREPGPQRARRDHAAGGARDLRTRGDPVRAAQDPTRRARRGERGVRQHHRGRGDAGDRHQRHAGGQRPRRWATATATPASSRAASSRSTGASARRAGTASGWRTSSRADARDSRVSAPPWRDRTSRKRL